MKRVLVSLLALTFAAVACGKDSPVVPNVTTDKSPTKEADAGSENDGATTSPPPASGCANFKDEEGTTSYGCCLPTGRCGFYVVALNACVEAAQIGAPESDATCTYAGDGTGEDGDKDKDDDEKDDDAKDDD